MRVVRHFPSVVALALAFVTLEPVPFAAEAEAAPRAQRTCKMNAIQRSKCIIEAILADVAGSYTQIGGGGITAIKQETTTSYTVSISQEERIDMLTYEISVGDDGAVKIVAKKAATKSMAP